MIHDLLELVAVFARLSLAAFGGGVGVLPEMERQAVGHGWVTHREFVDVYALGQVTPGPGMLVSVVIGQRAAGVPGAIVAGIAMFLPSSLLTWIVTERWGRLPDSPLVTAIREGMSPVALGLYAGGLYTLARTAIDGPLTAVMALLTIVALLRFGISPAVPVLAGGALGWILFR
jgi:chromate transporter